MYSGTESATLSKSVEKKFANLMKNKALLNAGQIPESDDEDY